MNILYKDHHREQSTEYKAQKTQAQICCCNDSRAREHHCSNEEAEDTSPGAADVIVEDKESTIVTDEEAEDISAGATAIVVVE